MTFYIISEPIFNTSSWYKNIMDGLIELQRKRRLNLEYLTQVKELDNFTISDEDTVFVIGTNSEWLNSTLSACSRIFDNRIIVLGNHNRISGGIRYSTVMANISESIILLNSYLRFHNKHNIALYGINPASSSDKLRTECFLTQGGSEKDLFYTNGSLMECFSSFSEKIHEYDGVICVNDYAAISLITHLKNSEYDRNLFTTSCGSSLLARLSAPSITHTQVDYTKFAESAYELYRILSKNKSVSSLTLQLSCDFVIGETTDFLPAPDSLDSSFKIMEKEDDLYYTDSEIKEMMNAEKLLINCDDQDLLIIEKLLCNKSSTDIAADLFMSQSAIKYKIKKMYNICNVHSREAFVSTLSKYIKVNFDE